MSVPESVNTCTEHFPVDWEDDAFVTRREFAKALGLASAAAFVGSLTLSVLSALRISGATMHPVLKIADLNYLGVGQSHIFYYPDEHSPCLLVRLGDDAFVAYDQKCTHLGCPVHYRAEEDEFYCPCHVGRFSVDDGRPLAGPPRRALPKIELSRKGDEIWTTGRILG